MDRQLTERNKKNYLYQVVEAKSSKKLHRELEAYNQILKVTVCKWSLISNLWMYYLPQRFHAIHCETFPEGADKVGELDSSLFQMLCLQSRSQLYLESLERSPSTAKPRERYSIACLGNVHRKVHDTPLNFFEDASSN